MSINLDQALQTFIAEARELLQDMEESLLRLENEPGDSDTLGAIFRAAHTIKGSAGLFGLEPVVGFTHIVEDVLDRVRDGAVVINSELVALRGSVDLDSQAGRGTKVRIRLPLTLAIIDGFLVGVGQASYVVPLDMVQECLELTEEDRQATRERNYLNLRGEVLPLVYLREQFNAGGSSGWRENVVVVVRCGEQKAGLVVDELQGEFQTVIKPLGKLFSTLRGIGGSTILGSGEVALILDVPNLLQQVAQQQAHNHMQPALAEAYD